MRAWPRGPASGAPPFPPPSPLIIFGGAYDSRPQGSPATTDSHTQHLISDEPSVDGGVERATYILLSERLGRSGRSSRGAEVVRAWPRGLASGAPPFPLLPL